MTSQKSEHQNQANHFLARQAHLDRLIQEAKLNALMLNPGPSLVYLTGLHFHLSERPVVAIFTPDNPVRLVIPGLEIAKTASLPYGTRFFTYGEDPAGWPAVFQEAARTINLHGTVGVEPTRMRFLEFQLMEGAAPQANYVSAEGLLAQLRMSKDAFELDCMRKAVDIAQNALLNVIPKIRIGMTERQLAAELTQELFHGGSDVEIPFSPIVSGGPNSANPHASPSDRPLSTGDLLVIDWGAAYQGYFSDLTRTFAVGTASREFNQIADIVHQANAAGRLACGPQVTAESIDAAARSVIQAAGYGDYFTHRTGHGLGMEGHEAPYIRAGNKLILEPGMTFTIEPGIYLPDRGGVRIEDNVAIRQGGVECLSDLPRELISVG